MNTIRLQHYYDFNLDKHRANYGAVSLDSTFGDDDDAANTILDTLVDEKDVARQEYLDGENVAISYIQSYINKSKLIEAIILDTIAFNDVEKQVKKTVKSTDENGITKKYTYTTSEFWAHKLVQVLSTLPADFETYFISKYKVNQDALGAALDSLRKANNQKLYKYLRTCLANCKKDFR